MSWRAPLYPYGPQPHRISGCLAHQFTTHLEDRLDLDGRLERLEGRLHEAATEGPLILQ